jgi:hypothetical protein
MNYNLVWFQKMLKIFVGTHGGWDEASKLIGVDKTMINAVCHGREKPSTKILDFFGLYKIDKDRYASDVEGIK